MEKKHIEYRLAGRESAKDQMDIYNLVFNEDAKLPKWEKKHYGNPATSQERLYGAFDGDKLVGINGFLEMPYVYKGIEYKLIQSCDTAVDPAYRGQGIFTGIIMNAEEQFTKEGYDAMIGFPNGNSHHGFMKMGWIDMLRTRKLFLPANIPAVIYNMKGKKLPKITNIANFVLWKAVRSSARKGRDLTVERRILFTVEDYHKLIDMNCIYFNADQHLLDWKLEDIDGYYIVKKGQKEMAFFLVASYDYPDGMKRANIILSNGYEDFQEEYKNGLAKVMIELKKKYDLVCIWQPYEEYQKQAIKKLGFLGNVVTTDGSPFIVKILTEDVGRIEVLKNSGNWKPYQLETDTMICLDR